MYKESANSSANPKIPFQSTNFQREYIDRALKAFLRELEFNLSLSDVLALILVYLLLSELNGFWKTLDLSSQEREDFEEYRNLYGSVYRHCICLRFLAQQLMHMYTLILQREGHTLPPSSTSPASVAPTSDDFFSGTFRSPPRPLPYDDPRCSQLHAGGSSTMHDNPLTQVYEELEPLRRMKNDCRTESTSISDKWSGYNSGVSKKGYSESSLKHSLIEIVGGVAYIFPSSEEEDVCPTCLEEYTPENPRIILQCSHHFHLVCIYEWMERSELCPLCGKVMVFNETS